MATILIVEDDAAVRLIIKTKLHQHYSVLEACNGTEALDLLDHTHVDLLIVDIQMPAMDGVSLLHTLRETGDKRPVLILTAMTSYQYKKRSFDAGADDYMTKPVDYDELILRIRALLRRANIANENKIVAGNLIMNKNEYSTMYRNTQIDLTSKEFDLLFLMLSYPGTVFTKQQLMDQIWGYDTESDYDTIKSHISRIRNKLSACSEIDLCSIRGLGYRVVIQKTGERNGKEKD